MAKCLLIKSCTDSLLWYSSLVGQNVPYLGRFPEAYKSRDLSGCTNIVHFKDAEIVDAEGESLDQSKP
jgi:hypothetical protein